MDKYLKLIPESERDNLVQAYYKRLTSQNLEERLSAAKSVGVIGKGQVIWSKTKNNRQI